MSTCYEWNASINGWCGTLCLGDVGVELLPLPLLYLPLESHSLYMHPK